MEENQTVVSAPVDAVQVDVTPTEPAAEMPTNTGETVVESAVDAPKPDNVGEAIKREVERREAQLRKQYEEQYAPYQQHSDQLKRAARLNGWGDDVDGYIARLDEVERQEQYEREASRMGIDPDTYAQYFAPVNQELNQLRQEVQRFQSQQTEAQRMQETQKQWNALYEAFPQLAETSQAFNDGKAPEWFTPQMQQLIGMGYQPVHAYELAHKETIMSQFRKQTEANTIRGLQQNSESSPGALGQGDVAHETGFSGLSREQQRRMIDEVKRGERRSF
jgi:DNA repair ATPase RecN